MNKGQEVYMSYKMAFAVNKSLKMWTMWINSRKNILDIMKNPRDALK